MDLIEKIPSMADDALSNLRANAERLGQTGSAAQRTAAANLLPVIEAELAARRTAKLERAAAARASRRKAATAATADAA